MSDEERVDAIPDVNDYTCEPSGEPAAAVLVTGNARVDAILAELADLKGLSPAEQYELLSRAHEKLVEVMNQPIPDLSQPAIPGLSQT